jgi:hypothetical protein
MRGEWKRNNRYMNFRPNRVPQSTTRLGPKLVRVLAIATRRTRLGFEVQAKWVRVWVFHVSIFRLGFYAQTKRWRQGNPKPGRPIREEPLMDRVKTHA